MRLPLFTHTDMSRHTGGPGHPERPERLTAVLERLSAVSYADRLTVLTAEPAAGELLRAVHSPRYLERLERTAGSAVTVFDSDTRANEWTYRAATLASGCAVAAVDAACAETSTGPAARPFAVVRPPGHHAEPDRAMGFCFVNSAAVAAEYAIRELGLARVAIVDWDVHHGNGTQRIFWERSDVFYASVHQYPLYPGTGAAEERGAGEGRGATLNIPLRTGSTEVDYLKALDGQLLPALERFAPQLIIVSAGFDAHADDPLATMGLTAASYGRMTARLLAIAARHAEGRIVHVLEGGYHLGALAAGVDCVLRTLLEIQEQEME